MKKKSKKGGKKLLITLAVIVFLFVYWLFDVGLMDFKFIQNKKATKIYRNKDLGFRFDYQGSSLIDYEGDYGADGGIFLVKLSDNSLVVDGNNHGDVGYFALEIVEKDTHWLQKFGYTDCVVLNEQTTSIYDDAQKTKLFKKDGAYNRHYLFYCVEKDNKVYLFLSNYSLSLGNGEKVERFFTKILSTFRFYL